MREITGLVCGVLLLLLPAQSRADVIVLRDGSAMSGTITGREAIVPGATCQDLVSITSQEGISKQFAADSVAYVIIEDSGTARTVYMDGYPAGAAALEQAESSRSSTRDVLLIGGLAVGGVGVGVKFGGERVEVTEDGIDVQEHSYNSVNYALMVGGAGMVLAGLMLAPGGPGVPFSVAPASAPFSGALALICSMRF